MSDKFDNLSADQFDDLPMQQGKGIPGELDGIAVPCPFTLTIAGHRMQCQMEKGHHLQTEHSFSIDWAHVDSDQKIKSVAPTPEKERGKP